MDLLRLIYILSFAYFAVSIPSVNPPVKKINSCQCKVPKGVIDLSSLDSGNSSIPTFNVSLPGNLSGYVEYNPCTSIQQECSKGNVSVCVIKGENALTFGQSTNVQFEVDNSFGLYLVSYSINKVNDSFKNYTSRIKLSCQIDKEKDFNIIDFHPDKNITFELKSKYACPHAERPFYSIGSVLCIIFLIAIVVYIFGGLSYNRYNKRIIDAKVFPHYEFWKELPLLVKDGFKYIFSGCKPIAPHGYNAI